MSSDPRIFNFILYGNFTNEAIDLYLEDTGCNKRLMLKDVYRALLTDLNTFKNDDYKYPYFLGSTPNGFMLDMNNKLYILESDSN